MDGELENPKPTWSLSQARNQAGRVTFLFGQLDADIIQAKAALPAGFSSHPPLPSGKDANVDLSPQLQKE